VVSYRGSEGDGCSLSEVKSYYLGGTAKKDSENHWV